MDQVVSGNSTAIGGKRSFQYAIGNQSTVANTSSNQRTLMVKKSSAKVGHNVMDPQEQLSFSQSRRRNDARNNTKKGDVSSGTNKVNRRLGDRGGGRTTVVHNSSSGDTKEPREKAASRSSSGQLPELLPASEAALFTSFARHTADAPAKSPNARKKDRQCPHETGGTLRNA
jgi:hypothetical protein